MKVYIEYKEDIGLENEEFDNVEKVNDLVGYLRINYFMSKELEEQEIVTNITINKKCIKGYRVSN